MPARHDMVTYFGKRYSLSAQALERIRARLTDVMSGADVENLCREEGMERVKGIVSQIQHNTNS
jgi:SpoVK/Ycf46/Vps4 family AAA+-type ATPase